MTSIEIVNGIISQVKEKCLEWVEIKGSDFFFIDPLEEREIYAHYGASHAAVSFLILGLKQHDSKLESIGVGLLTSVLKRWESSSKLADFHNDFNHFVLCIAAGYLRENEKYADLYEKIKRTIMSTPDSIHDTINWLPMRWYVNKCRYEWSGQNCYMEKCLHLAKSVKAATFEDGYIDDRLPKGTSFNLQYNIATVAVLQFLRNNGEMLDLSKEVAALINAVAPDGDSNYLGRGTNQVFAWGMWLYILLSAGFEDEAAKALGFCSERISMMLKKNNLMLNEWEGSERYLWWDYHYSSVYIAHLLFWLTLTIEDYRKSEMKPVLPDIHDSGLQITRDNGWFLAQFAGRNEYLSEYGPTIVALGRSDGKMIVKGAFGPWKGSFGNKYCCPSVLFQNYFGISRVGKRDSQNRILRKISVYKKKKSWKLNSEPLFKTVRIIETKDTQITLQWVCDKGDKVLTIPICCCESDIRIRLTVDGKEVPVLLVSRIRNQYQWINVLQSNCLSGTEWTLMISVGEK